VATKGLYFLILGEGIILVSNSVRVILLGWPAGVIGWGLALLSLGALLLLLLVVQAAVREYWGRADKPRQFWKLPNLLE
jgi:hypothetical protein